MEDVVGATSYDARVPITIRYSPNPKEPGFRGEKSQGSNNKITPY